MVSKGANTHLSLIKVLLANPAQLRVPSGARRGSKQKGDEGESLLIRYTIRTYEAYQKLLKCTPVARRIYDALEFHRDPHGKITNKFSHGDLSELSSTTRKYLKGGIDCLEQIGLIRIISQPRKSKWQFELLLIPEAGADLTQSCVVGIHDNGEESEEIENVPY